MLRLALTYGSLDCDVRDCVDFVVLDPLLVDVAAVDSVSVSLVWRSGVGPCVGSCAMALLTETTAVGSKTPGVYTGGGVI